MKLEYFVHGGSALFTSVNTTKLLTNEYQWSMRIEEARILGYLSASKLCSKVQPREIRNQYDRLPAEGRLGTSENTGKSRCYLFCCSHFPSLYTRHLFDIRRLVTFPDWIRQSLHTDANSVAFQRTGICIHSFYLFNFLQFPVKTAQPCFETYWKDIFPEVRVR
jgi:hypothetical protein